MPLVCVSNDARAATLGEFGFGHPAPNMVLYTLDTGIGGGVIIDGKLRLGKSVPPASLVTKSSNPTARPAPA